MAVAVALALFPGAPSLADTAAAGDDAPGAMAVEAVRCTEVAFSHSVEQRDKARFAGFLDGDARFIGNGVLRGPEAIVEGWSVFLDSDYPRLTWRPRIVEVLEEGTLALSRGPYRLEVQADDGSVSEQWGIFNSVWRLGDDSRWRVVFDAGHPGSGDVPDEDRALLNAPDGCAPAP